MQFIHRQWHWLLPLLPVPLVTDISSYLLAMMIYGDSSFAVALSTTLKRSHDYWSSSLFLLALTSLPFLLISIICIIVGGWVGALCVSLPMMISIWRPFFTPERVSSTHSLAFLMIPVVAIPFTVVGMLIGNLVSGLVAGVFRIPLNQPNSNLDRTSGPLRIKLARPIRSSKRGLSFLFLALLIFVVGSFIISHAMGIILSLFPFSPFTSFISATLFWVLYLSIPAIIVFGFLPYKSFNCLNCRSVITIVRFRFSQTLPDVYKCRRCGSQFGLEWESRSSIK